MARAKQLLCPNCNAPLPVVTLQTRTECTYCGRPIILEPPPTAQRPPPVAAPYPPPGPNPHVGVPRPRSSKAPLIITLVIVGISIGMALMIFTFINRTVERSRDTSRVMAQEIEEQMRRSVDTQIKEMERAFDLPELEALEAEADAARLQAELAREEAAARREAATRSTKRSRTRKPAAKPLPDDVDDALVERALAKLDVSHCPGTGFVVYTMRADASGKLSTVSHGPMRISGGTSQCVSKVVDEAKRTVRFPKSKNGSGPVKRRFEVTAAEGGQGH